MRSPDTNVLLYALNADCPECDTARRVLEELGASDDVVICELVLVELYLLLRSPAVLRRPLSAADAVDVLNNSGLEHLILGPFLASKRSARG